jgi:hydrogenase maturation protease
MNDETPSILLAGIGNEFRSDDAAGLRIAEQIRSIGLSGVQIVTLGDHLDQLLDLWDGRALAVLVDAVRSGAEPGTVLYLDLLNESLPSSLTATSTHSLDPLQLVQMARLLDRLPQQLYLIGIEAADFTVGTEMSDAVSNALPQATDQILALFFEVGIE